MTWIALAFVLLWAWRRMLRSERRMRALEAELAELRNAVAAGSGRAAEPAPEPSPTPGSILDRPSQTEPSPRPARVGQTAPAAAAGVPRPSAPRPVEGLPAQVASRWRPLERALISSGSGILGAVLLVAGVTFLGIYTALTLAPETRFALLVAGSALLVVGGAGMRLSERWRALGAWLRSAGAALFLLACFGASSIPGLRFVEGQGPALGLLALGIGTNMVVAALGRAEAVAAAHVVLSFVPLAIVPTSETALVLATGVAGVGVALAWRSRWDRHLLASVGVYTLYHGRFALLATSTADRALALVAAAAIGVAAVCIHHRSTRSSTPVVGRALAAHLAGFALLAEAGLLAPHGARLRCGLLLAAAALAFGLARRARGRGSRGLYRADALAAQALGAAAILALRPLVFDTLLLALLLCAATAVWTAVIAEDGELTLVRAGFLLLHGSAAAAALMGIHRMAEGLPVASPTVPLLFATAFVCTAAHAVFVRRHGEAFDALSLYGRDVAERSAEGVSLLGLLAGVLVAVAILAHSGDVAREAVAAGAAALLLLVARGLGSRSLGLSALVALGVSYLVCWETVLPASIPAPELGLRLAPLAVAGSLAVALPPAGSFRRPLRRLAVHALAAHLAIAAFVLLDPHSPLAPGVAWLVLSAGALLLTRASTDRGLARGARDSGYGLLAAFLAAFVWTDVWSQRMLGPLPARCYVEAVGLAVFGLWAASAEEVDATGGSRGAGVHALLLEAFFAYAALVVLAEASAQARPLLWIAAALVLGAGLAGRLGPRRLRLHGLLFFWASALDAGIVTSRLEMPSTPWLARPEVTGGVAVALQALYLGLCGRHLDFGADHLPVGLRFLARPLRAIERRPVPWLYHPFFATVALFVWWRFDPSLRTLLWAIEAFGIFVLSAVLHENQLRVVALVGLGACLVRLVVYDLARSDTLTRGIVFLGVGILLLAMNSLYTHFQERFE